MGLGLRVAVCASRGNLLRTEQVKGIEFSPPQAAHVMGGHMRLLRRSLILPLLISGFSLSSLAQQNLTDAQRVDLAGR